MQEKNPFKKRLTFIFIFSLNLFSLTHFIIFGSKGIQLEKCVGLSVKKAEAFGFPLNFWITGLSTSFETFNHTLYILVDFLLIALLISTVLWFLIFKLKFLRNKWIRLITSLITIIFFIINLFSFLMWYGYAIFSIEAYQYHLCH